ncbi:MAG: prefoldin subunit alpha [Nanoarchaeota archaeon]|nr:prefoldin subunit alpha [Nanoarchaeota archaeon]
MAREELILKLQMLEQRAEERRQQIGETDRQIEEMMQLRMSLERLESSRGKEILSALGRGVFLNTKVNDDKVFVNVGRKVLVRKTFKEAIEILDNQLEGLEAMKSELMNGVEEINLKLYELLEEAQKAEKEN